MTGNLIQKQVWSMEQPIRVELLETETIPDGATLNRGLWVMPNEIDMYLTSYSSRSVAWFKMATKGVMSSRVLQSNTSLGGEAGDNSEAIWLSDDGFKMVVSGVNGTLRSWTLATAGDPSTKGGKSYIPTGGISLGNIFSIIFSQTGLKSIISCQYGVFQFSYSNPFGGSASLVSSETTAPLMKNGFAVWRNRQVGVNVSGTFYRLKGDLELPLSKINDTSGIEYMAPFFGCFPSGTNKYYQKRKGSTNIIMKKYKIL